MNKITILKLLIIITLVSSCKTDEKSTPAVQKEVHIEEKLSDNLNIETPINSVETPITDSIYLYKKEDTAYLKNRNIVIYKTYVQPLKQTGGTKENPQEISDEAFLMSNCLIYLKNIRSAGHFCHTPSIDEVHIINIQGNKMIHRSTEKNSIIGFNFTSCFQGGRFNAPNNTWGIITIEAEGELYGFLHIKNTGKVTNIPYLPKEGDNSYSEIRKPYFKNSNAFILPGIQTDENLILTKQGEIIRQKF
jgi:hypothetical protein